MEKYCGRKNVWDHAYSMLGKRKYVLLEREHYKKGAFVRLLISGGGLDAQDPSPSCVPDYHQVVHNTKCTIAESSTIYFQSLSEERAFLRTLQNGKRELYILTQICSQSFDECLHDDTASYLIPDFVVPAQNAIQLGLLREMILNLYAVRLYKKGTSEMILSNEASSIVRKLHESFSCVKDNSCRFIQHVAHRTFDV